MQIVIDMPDSTTKEMLENFESGSLFDEVLRGALKRAIILPKEHGRFDYEQEPILDKIRAEIEKEADTSNRLHGISEIGLRKALKIIEKYKSESEG